MTSRSSAAERQRRHRERQRKGIAPLVVEVDLVAFAAGLIAAGVATPDETLDRAGLERAAQTIVRQWIKHVSRT